MVSRVDDHYTLHDDVAQVIQPCSVIGVSRSMIVEIPFPSHRNERNDICITIRRGTMLARFCSMMGLGCICQSDNHKMFTSIDTVSLY